MTRTGSFASLRAASRPPNPAPITTTRGSLLRMSALPGAAGNHIRRYPSERYIDSSMSNRTELFAATKEPELAGNSSFTRTKHSRVAGDQYQVSVVYL